MADSARTEEIRAEWREAAKGIAEDAHCRYCDFQNQDSRLKCKRDVELAVKEIVELVDSETAALREEVERLKGALTSANPFSGGPDGDICLWCNRDQPREWSEFSELFLPDNHDADCQLIAALSPSPAQQEQKA